MGVLVAVGSGVGVCVAVAVRDGGSAWAVWDRAAITPRAILVAMEFTGAGAACGLQAALMHNSKIPIPVNRGNRIIKSPSLKDGMSILH